MHATKISEIIRIHIETIVKFKKEIIWIEYNVHYIALLTK